MPKLLIAFATAILLIISGGIIWKAEAAMPAASLPQGTKTISPAACWCGPYRCACRRYWGPRYGYYRRWRY
jgi:hypothetical protein